MTAFDAVFFDAMKGAGLTVEARFALPNCPTMTVVDVTFREDDDELASGARSRRYVIDYEFQRAPTVIEGTEVEVVGHGVFKVRETPRIPIERASNGYWRRATLTRIDDRGDA